MNCYTHRTTVAIAFCRACSRALCPEFCVEVGRTCGCKGRCESEVATINRLTEQSSRVFKGTSHLLRRNGIFVLLFALVFIAFAVILLAAGDDGVFTAFLLVVGFLFGGIGVVSLVASKRFRQDGPT